jgi:hypothetical protein
MRMDSSSALVVLLTLSFGCPSGLFAQTTPRATTPTLAADQSGCAAINYYDVGPGKPNTSLSQLPWSNLKGCDTVRIYPKVGNAPYHEMMLISAGTNLTPTTPTRFMRVLGVPDPVTGVLPIIDGTNATQLETPPGQASRSLRYISNTLGDPNRVLYKLGLVMVSGQSGRDYNYGPAGYISIENLEIRNGSYGTSFIDGLTNAPDSYGTFTSCIFVEVAAHLVLKNNILHDCGNGLFINSKNATLVELSQDVLVQGNKLYSNGNAIGTGGSNGFSEHNSYTEARDIIFQYNTFGDVKPGAFGDCLKDRSSGLIVRYNRFSSNCGIKVNLLDATGGGALIHGDAGYATSHVYGNVFEMSGPAESNLLAYGGDSGVPAIYRQGTLYFFNNTLVVEGDANHGAYASVFLFRLDIQNAVAEVSNNVFQASPTTPNAPGQVQAMSYGHGTVNLSGNWVSPNAGRFWLDHTVPGAVVNGWSSNIGASNQPMFVDELLHDFRPSAGSPLIDAGVPLDAEISASGNLPVGVVGFDPGAVRPADGAIDIGAYEFPSGDGIFADSFE